MYIRKGAVLAPQILSLVTQNAPHYTFQGTWNKLFPREAFSLFLWRGIQSPFNPSSPNIHIQILQTDPHASPLRISWENLIKDHGIFSMMIILLILITLSLDSVWILLGENCCWSLLGLKGLNPTSICNHFSLMPTRVLSRIYRLGEKSRVAESHKLPSGNSMISSDIWHIYHKWYFKIVMRNFTSR